MEHVSDLANGDGSIVDPVIFERGADGGVHLGAGRGAIHF